MTPTRLALLVPLLALSACPMAGNYHSARTLEKGTSAVGMTFSITQYETDVDNDGMTEKFAWPNFIPELTYHVGITDDVEVGGRVALGSMGMEADVKWRFYHNDKLHVAIAPAIGYQAFVFLQGGLLRLPGVLTYDLNEHFALNLAVFGSSTHFSSTNDVEGAAAFDGTLVATGAAFGVEIRGETLMIRPALEFTRFVADFDGETFEPFNTVNILVHIAFIGGREKKQLNRMERKLDRVIDNQEGGQGGPPETDDSDYVPEGEPMR